MPLWPFKGSLPSLGRRRGGSPTRRPETDHVTDDAPERPLVRDEAGASATAPAGSEEPGVALRQGQAGSSPLCQKSQGCLLFSGHRGKCSTAEKETRLKPQVLAKVGQGRSFDPKNLFVRKETAAQEGADRSNDSQPAEILRFGRDYRVGRKIGEGTFGQVYLAENISTGEKFALKGEPVTVDYPQIPTEANFLALLSDYRGFPSLRWWGIDNECHAIVIDLLGLSLFDLFKSCRERFSLKTVAILAQQMVTRLEEVHGKGIVHRDVKPENFLMGLGDRAGDVHLVDFGLAKFYRHAGAHVPFAPSRALTGTPRFASIHAHTNQQSRRDDLEAVGHVLVYFAAGSLPWQALHASGDESRFGAILEMKRSLSPEEVCAKCPDPVFARFLRYCRELDFEQAPDYELLRGLFRDVLQASGDTDDRVFEWSTGAELQPWDDVKGTLGEFDDMEC